jgi:hypothetical protein
LLDSWLFSGAVSFEEYYERPVVIDLEGDGCDMFKNIMPAFAK